MLVELAAWPANDMTGAITHLISVGMLTGDLTVQIGIRGRHPGWVSMALASVLIEAGR